MSASRDAPEVVIKNLLRDEWDASQTLSVTPDVHHGWLTEDLEQVEVTVSDIDEVPIGGGETGYSGITPDTGHPTQDIRGTLAVNCWADRNRTDENPRQLAYLMKEQAVQILRDHYDATDAGGNDTTLEFLSPLGATRIIEDEDDPERVTTFRYRVEAGFGYRVVP